MHPYEDILNFGDIAVHQGHVLFAVEHALKDDRLKRTVLSRQGRLRHALHQLLVVATVADQIGDCHQGQSVLGREDLELGQTRHVGLVLGHNLTENPRGVLPRHSA